ncbi:hypothetical protein QUC31_010000 [Theobroma cacao]
MDRTRRKRKIKQIEREIKQMEKKHAKDILEMELEGVEDELEENEEVLHSPARLGWRSSSSDDNDFKGLLSIIQTEDVEQRKQGFGKLIQKFSDMVEISRIDFDDVLKSLMISLDSEGLMVLQRILMLASQPQLTEAQVSQLMPKLDLILMEGKINETDQMLDCLSIIVHSNFNLLGHYKLLVPKSVAYCWREMQLYDDMVEWLEKIIKKDHCDADDKRTVSVLKHQSSLLFHLVILGIFENCSAMDQVILDELKNLNREEFAKEWQKLEDLAVELNRMLRGLNTVKITGALFVLENISRLCLTERSLAKDGVSRESDMLMVVDQNSSSSKEVMDFDLV